MKVSYWRRFKGELIVKQFEFVDLLPWFARKRLFNLLLGSDSWTDFMQTDRMLDKFDWPLRSICIKW